MFDGSGLRYPETLPDIPFVSTASELPDLHPETFGRERIKLIVVAIFPPLEKLIN